MTIWRGWSENDVRQQRTASGITGSFTAINGSSDKTSQVATSLQGRETTHDENASRPQTIVSGYLGRGDNHRNKAVVATISTRNIGTRTTKRMSTTWNVTKPKRLKSRLDCAVQGVPETVLNVESPPITKQIQFNQGGDRAPRKVAVVDADETRLPQDDAVLPVYVTATSMTNLKPVAQTTSVAHFRASVKYGHAMYTSSPMPSLQQSGLEHSQLSHRAVLPTQSPVRSFEDTPHLECQHMPTIGDEVAATAQTSSSMQPPSTSGMAGLDESDTSLCEFELDSDDDFNDQVLNIMDSISSSTKLPHTSRSQSLDYTNVSVQQATPVSSAVPHSSFIADDRIVEDFEWCEGDDCESDKAQKDRSAESRSSTDMDNVQIEAPYRSRTAKQNVREVDADEEYGGIMVSEQAQQPPGRRASGLSSDESGPIARAVFPRPVSERSPLFGVGTSSTSRTCFRIGEALNVGCQAVRQNKHVILELYARVTRSWREDSPSRKQNFFFRDLYHDNPPSLNGTCELWDQLRVWDLDSRPFLCATEHGLMCRAIATMKRDGKGWKLEVLNIREVSWDEIKHVAGIYRSDRKHDANAHVAG